MHLYGPFFQICEFLTCDHPFLGHKSTHRMRLCVRDASRVPSGAAVMAAQCPSDKSLPTALIARGSQTDAHRRLVSLCPLGCAMGKVHWSLGGQTLSEMTPRRASSIFFVLALDWRGHFVKEPEFKAPSRRLKSAPSTALQPHACM